MAVARNAAQQHLYWLDFWLQVWFCIAILRQLPVELLALDIMLAFASKTCGAAASTSGRSLAQDLAKAVTGVSSRSYHKNVSSRPPQQPFPLGAWPAWPSHGPATSVATPNRGLRRRTVACGRERELAASNRTCFPVSSSDLT
jgi:hypothetical protein